MEKIRNFGIFSLIVVLLLGCTTKTKDSKTDLDRTMKLEEPASSPQANAQRAAEVFANAPGLTNEQRLQLLGIYSRTYTEAFDIRVKIG